MCKTSLGAIFWSSCDQREKANFGRKVKKMVPPTHDIQVPPREAGRADFRHDMVKPLGFAYVLEKNLKKKFRTRFWRSGPDEQTHTRMRQANGPRTAMRKNIRICLWLRYEIRFGASSAEMGHKFRNFLESFETFLITIQSDAELAAVYRNGRIS